MGYLLNGKGRVLRKDPRLLVSNDRKWKVTVTLLAGLSDEEEISISVRDFLHFLDVKTERLLNCACKQCPDTRHAVSCSVHVSFLQGRIVQPKQLIVLPMRTTVATHFESVRWVVNIFLLFLGIALKSVWRLTHLDVWTFHLPWMLTFFSVLHLQRISFWVTHSL